MLNFAINNETTGVIRPLPFLTNNPYIEDMSIMAESRIPLNEQESQIIRAKYPPMETQWLRGKEITKEILLDMYLTKKMSSIEIGGHLGVSANTICNKLKKFKIGIRQRIEDITGKNFGRWTAISRAENGKGGRAKWLCECECGTKRLVSAMSLLRGDSKSCGCLIADLARSRNGKNHPSYKNGRTKKEGYILILDRTHPNANKRGRLLEHVFVMSKHLNRPIKTGETIHHKNGIRDDNRIENLELWSKKHPPGQRIDDMVEFCVDYLKQYAPQKLAKEKLCGFN